MKISKLFHWLYAILMLMPFVALVFNFVRFGLSSDISLTSFDDVIRLVFVPTGNINNSVVSVINNVYSYLIYNVFGYTYNYVLELICNLLGYWTIISIVYLIFDVLMYVPLLVHRWIDKARLE